MSKWLPIKPSCDVTLAFSLTLFPIAFFVMQWLFDKYCQVLTMCQPFQVAKHALSFHASDLLLCSPCAWNTLSSIVHSSFSTDTIQVKQHLLGSLSPLSLTGCVLPIFCTPSTHSAPPSPLLPQDYELQRSKGLCY